MVNRVKRALRAALCKFPANQLPVTLRSVLYARLNTPSFPVSLQFEPTRRCNLRCVMCALTQFYFKEVIPDMPLDVFKRILAQFPKELNTVIIQGTGEPLLSKDIISMIEFARSLGKRTHFNTNLLPLTEEMAERLVAAGHSEVMVSIETADPGRYADLRRNGTIDQFLEKLNILNAAKERAGSEFPKITACCILMRHTLDDIPELVATLKAHGVIKMHVADLCTYPEYGGDLLLADGTDLREQSLSANMPEEEVWEVVKRIKALEDDAFEIAVPGEEGGLKTEKPYGNIVLTCADLWRVPFIKPDGKMATCCWAPQFVMGDFAKQSFREIWFGEEYRKMRQSHLQNKHPRHCRECQQLMYQAMPPVKHGEGLYFDTSRDVFL